MGAEPARNRAADSSAVSIGRATLRVRPDEREPSEHPRAARFRKSGTWGPRPEADRQEDRPTSRPGPSFERAGRGPSVEGRSRENRPHRDRVPVPEEPGVGRSPTGIRGGRAGSPRNNVAGAARDLPRRQAPPTTHPPRPNSHRGLRSAPTSAPDPPRAKLYRGPPRRRPAALAASDAPARSALPEKRGVGRSPTFLGWAGGITRNKRRGLCPRPSAPPGAFRLPEQRPPEATRQSAATPARVARYRIPPRAERAT